MSLWAVYKQVLGNEDLMECDRLTRDGSILERFEISIF